LATSASNSAGVSRGSWSLASTSRISRSITSTTLRSTRLSSASVCPWRASASRGLFSRVLPRLPAELLDRPARIGRLAATRGMAGPLWLLYLDCGVAGARPAWSVRLPPQWLAPGRSAGPTPASRTARTTRPRPTRGWPARRPC